MFLIIPSYSENDIWYEYSNITLTYDKFVKIGVKNNKPIYRSQFYFINSGHSIYVAEFKLLDKNAEYNPWTVWLGDWKAWEDDGRKYPKSFAWLFRNEDTLHFFSVGDGITTYNDMLIRVVAIKPELWKNYVQYQLDLLINAD